MAPHDLIANYGLFWDPKIVHWGAGSNKGHLLGIADSETGYVDFRDQRGFYALYHDYELLYIGQVGSGNAGLFKRIKSHHRREPLAGRWNMFSWFGTRRVLKSGKLAAPTAKKHPAMTTVLDQVEAILIAVAEPKLNRQGGKFGNANAYEQVYDEDALGLEESEMLREMYVTSNELLKRIERIEDVLDEV